MRLRERALNPGVTAAAAAFARNGRESLSFALGEDAEALTPIPAGVANLTHPRARGSTNYPEGRGEPYVGRTPGVGGLKDRELGRPR